MVTVTIDLPPELEKEFQATARDVARDVKEAFALELYRQEKLSFHDLSCMLGISHFETSALLQRHRIYVGSLTLQDLEDDRRRLDEVFAKEGK